MACLNTVEGAAKAGPIRADFQVLTEHTVTQWGHSNYPAITLSNNAVCSDCMQGRLERVGFVSASPFSYFMD